jgi:hypothetical protein
MSVSPPNFFNNSEISGTWYGQLIVGMLDPSVEI